VSELRCTAVDTRADEHVFTCCTMTCSLFVKTSLAMANNFRKKRRCCPFATPSKIWTQLL